MKDSNEINNSELNSVFGGSSKLEKYLKELVDEETLKFLLEHEKKKKLKINPTKNYEDDDNTYVLDREEDRIKL